MTYPERRSALRPAGAVAFRRDPVCNDCVVKNCEIRGYAVSCTAKIVNIDQLASTVDIQFRLEQHEAELARLSKMFERLEARLNDR